MEPEKVELELCSTVKEGSPLALSSSMMIDPEPVSPAEEISSKPPLPDFNV